MLRDIVIPAKITNAEEAGIFLKALWDVQLAFHPDDDPADVVDDAGPVFTPEECDVLRPLIDQIFAVPEFDPYYYILRLDPDYKEYDFNEEIKELIMRHRDKWAHVADIDKLISDYTVDAESWAPGMSETEIVESFGDWLNDDVYEKR